MAGTSCEQVRNQIEQLKKNETPAESKIVTEIQNWLAVEQPEKKSQREQCLAAAIKEKTSFKQDVAKIYHALFPILENGGLDPSDLTKYLEEKGGVNAVESMENLRKLLIWRFKILDNKFPENIRNHPDFPTFKSNTEELLSAVYYNINGVSKINNFAFSNSFEKTEDLMRKMQAAENGSKERSSPERRLRQIEKLLERDKIIGKEVLENFIESINSIDYGPGFDVRNKLTNEGITANSTYEELKSFIKKTFVDTGKDKWMRLSTPAEREFINQPQGLSAGFYFASPIEFSLQEMQKSASVQILPGSPAHKAGMRDGDVITKIDDTKIHTYSDLIQYCSAHEAESSLIVTYERGKLRRTIMIEKVELPSVNIDNKGDGRYKISFPDGQMSLEGIDKVENFLRTQRPKEVTFDLRRVRGGQFVQAKNLVSMLVQRDVYIADSYIKTTQRNVNRDSDFMQLKYAENYTPPAKVNFEVDEGTASAAEVLIAGVTAWVRDSFYTQPNEWRPAHNNVTIYGDSPTKGKNGVQESFNLYTGQRGTESAQLRLTIADWTSTGKEGATLKPPIKPHKPLAERTY